MGLENIEFERKLKILLKMVLDTSVLVCEKNMDVVVSAASSEFFKSSFMIFSRP